MAQLPQEISTTQSAIQRAQALVSSSQAEHSFAKEQINKHKEELLIAQSDLQVALHSESEEVEVERINANFPAQKIYSSRDWSFSKSQGSVFDQGSETCIAETKTKSSQGSTGALSVGKVLFSHEASEPTVFIKVSTNKFDQDTTSAKIITVTLPTSSDSFTMNLVPSLSSSDELIFMAKVEDREKLIKVILAEYSIKASVNHGEESFTFSLMGSTNTIKAADQSLASSCEGIAILD